MADTTETLSYKQRYYASKKNDEEWKEKHRAYRRAYYQRHKELERAKNLQRYYQNKATPDQQLAPPSSAEGRQEG